MFPPQTNDFQKPIKFVSTSRKVFFGKESEKTSEEKLVENRVETNQVSSPNSNLSLSLGGSIVAIVGKVAIRMSFASRGSVRR
jgi:hypothetical protein